jgi:hypothetical protein
MSELTVVSMGLSSPLGRTPLEHAFFVPAGVPLPSSSAFVDADGQRIRVRHTPWIGAHRPFADRCEVLAQQALETALGPVSPWLEETPLLVCSSHRRAALLDPGIERAARRVPARSVERFDGAAGTFAALVRASALLASGARFVVVLAVDSEVHIDALTEWVERPPSWWSHELPPPSEAAAALVLTAPAEARRLGLEVVGTILGAGTRPAPSNDDNDEIVDGTALAELIRVLPIRAPIGVVAGPTSSGDLRMREWFTAMPRSLSKLAGDHELLPFEASMGWLGAAAGATYLVAGLASLVHETTAMLSSADRTLLAWAISRDGARGAATAVRGAG